MVICTPEALSDLAEVLAAHPMVAVDTEANSLYAYQERVCLIQFSVPGVDYLVDPLALEDLSLLAPLFASTEVEKIFHAADYDLMVLHRDFGFEVRALFDTMWAARILGWPKVGLGDILALHFDVHLNKRFQRYDWGQRPLPQEALTYAWMDSHYLLPLRQLQKAELEATGRWPEALEVFNYLATTVTVPADDSNDRHFWRIKGAHDLRPRELQLLYQLFRWRESTARNLDRPPVKVLSNARLMRLAQVQPQTRDELFATGLSSGQVRRFGAEILRALRANPLPDPPSLPRHVRPSDDVLERYKVLKAWRKNIADARGVDSDVILPNAVLWELAENPPQDMHALLEISGIGPWRQATYGPDLLQLVAE